MARIPEDTIQTIRDRVDILDVVGRSVSLKKAGRNFKGLCPFHEEKTPSFNVHPDRGTFHCFGCGEGGNVFTFLMNHDGLTFPEAVRSLAADL
ncbi:MAG: CHC2 zinc finger domain-containing protein, partial [Planctomycetota bacterium]|nr:CHC2 zinc finger domain-containing protein [Planctomycetota bacterium]